MTIECWPRQADVTNPDHKQFPGWPVKITQDDNYARKAVAYLPTLKITGQTDPVVQVIEESTGEIVYTLRVKGTSFRPKVFAKGKYTVKVGEGDSVKTVTGIDAIGPDVTKTIEVAL